MTTNLALQVKDNIVELIKNDALVLPTLPEIALQVREVAEDASTGINDLAQIVGRDPALTARIIKVTNSPLVRASSPVTDLITAISRLGIVYTSNLAVGLAMEQMFQATHDLIDKRLRACWLHSMEIAASSQILARHFTKLQPDQAMLAGLIHQIGVLPILSYAENHDGLLNDSLSLNFVLDKLHAPLGSYILRQWKFLPELVDVPKEHLNFTRNVPFADYADVVQVAVIQSHAGSNHPLAKIDRSKLSSFTRLGLDFSEDTGEWDNLAEELSANQTALMP